MKTVIDLINEGTEYLTNMGVSEPELSSQYLLSHVLGRKRLDILSEPKTPVSRHENLMFKKLLNLRAKSFPVSYITGTHNFMGIEISVAPGVFIPRPETEELVEKTLEYCFKIRKKNLKIMDFGTGSGCISVALALKTAGHPSGVLSQITAVDISEKALAMARKNAAKHSLLKRIRFVRAGQVSDVPGRFDLIISNPPYIPSNALNGLDPEVRTEPRIALEGGRDGLKIMKNIIAQAPFKLCYDGALWMEIGSNQKEKIKSLFSKKLWREVEFIKDYNNKYRFVRGQIRQRLEDIRRENNKAEDWRI